MVKGGASVVSQLPTHNGAAPTPGLACLLQMLDLGYTLGKE